MGLRFDPVGGGQFKQAVKTIIEAESQPIKKLEQRKSLEEARMKLFQEFKSKFGNLDKTLQEFTDARKFRELKVDLGDGANLMSVTVDKDTAETGSYQIQIDELAARSSIISNGFSSPDEKILGIGFIVLNLPNGESKEVFVDEGDSSLRNIETLINRQVESPVRAAVIKDLSSGDKPWKLILTSKKDGADDAIDYPDFYFLDGDEDFYIDDNHEAQNSFLKLDGFGIESDSNDVKDFLRGVNVHLKQARPDQPFTLAITEDHKKISEKVKGLVDQVNGLLEWINKQNQVDDKTDTKSTFTGDTGLQNVEYRLRNLVHEGFPTGDPDDEDSFKFVFLNQLGIEFNKAGLLQFKEEKFTKALEGDYERIAEGISGEFGFANQLRRTIAGYTRPGDGLLSQRERGFRDRISHIDDDIANKQRRIDQRQQALTAQFARLQGTLSSMQQQQAYLQSTLGGGGGGNLVQQLLGG